MPQKGNVFREGTCSKLPAFTALPVEGFEINAVKM